MGCNYIDRSQLVISIVNSSTLSQHKIMNSRRISLAIATVVTILSGTTLPSHADRSCPLGFTAGEVGCQKVVKVTIENICTNLAFPRLNVRLGRDVCSKINVVIPDGTSLDNFNEGVDFINSVADPVAKKKATGKITREIDPGFINPSAGGASSRQRRTFSTSETVLIDYDGSRRKDHTEIKFDLIITPNPPS
jgi:hypothetical protein